MQTGYSHYRRGDNMIKKDFYRTRNDGVRLFKSYSDQNLYIKKIGTEEVYSEAIDVENAPYVYIETDTPIETLENTLQGGKR